MHAFHWPVSQNASLAGYERLPDLPPPMFKNSLERGEPKRTLKCETAPPMDKRLRSSLQASPESFLSSATKLGLRSAKASLKSIIHGITPSSPLSASLPPALRNSISQSIASFRNIRDSGKSPPSPPTKRRRRSSRHAKNRDGEVKENNESGVLQDLQVLSHISFLCVSHPKDAFSSEDLLPAVQELHDNLILFESDSVLLSEIANLCEEWWKDGLVGREALISQSLPFLLSKSLALKKKVDVHRVYLLREAFALFDFEDESIEDLKLLMIRCVIAPLYLKTEDGRKFVAFMFGLSRQLVKEALAMIRSQIPFGRKSMLETYGDIVFQAWKHVEGESRSEIENGFLQGLIEGAIHASSGALAASIRRVLGGFINQRTTNGVEKLLFRLTEPVIFRSLQVASSNVRLNSLHLLLDTFPLEDPDATKETKDSILDKQFFLLERLLTDDCPEIRVVAVEGSCRILHLFWEIIPSSTITKMITKFFDDMSHDNCNEVRLSTLNGIIYLLGNPQSHEILKVLLPRLGHLILDPALSVRVAIADLLLVLRDIRTFQFHKVVGLDILLSALANDPPPVAQKITKLLIPSYFPAKVTPEEACKRCITLIKRSPKAGARFCEFALSEGASMSSLLELVKVFISLVLSRNKLQEDQIESLLAAAAYLCNSLVTEPLYRTALEELFSGGKLKCLFAVAETGPSQSSVVNIISSISPDAAAEFVDECVALLKDCSGLSEDTERQEKVRSVHKLMLSSDLFDDMFDVLPRLLQKAAYGCHIKFGTEMPKQCVPSMKRKKTESSFKVSAKEKRVSGKKLPNMSTSIFEEAYSNAIGVSWQIIDLLKSDGTRIALFRSKTLKPAFFALKAISEASIVHCMYYEHMDTTPILAYSSLALHLTLQNSSLIGANNKGLHFSRSSSWEQTVLERTMNHLLNCIEKLFQARDGGKPAKQPSECKKNHKKVANSCQQKLREPRVDPSSTDDGGTTFSEQKRISNVIKMLTAVLKFIVDAATMSLVSNNDARFLKFTTIYIQYTISMIRRLSQDQSQFNDDDLRGVFLYLKSSLTYTAKFLNLVLANTSEASPPPPDAYNLANFLLDLIISVETHLGSGYAARLVTALKPWLPDLVLALGARHIMKQTSEGTQFTESDISEFQLPSWTSVLAKIELDELTNISSSEEAERVSEPDKHLSFKKVVGMITLLLKGNSSILDAVGKIFMTGSAVALESEDFGVLLGLLHFVCVKLVGHEHRGWKGLDMMLASLEGIYPEIERQVERPSSSEHGSQKLEKARALLEPIWINHNCESEGPSRMEE